MGLRYQRFFTVFVILRTCPIEHFSFGYYSGLIITRSVCDNLLLGLRGASSFKSARRAGLDGQVGLALFSELLSCFNFAMHLFQCYVTTNAKGGDVAQHNVEAVVYRAQCPAGALSEGLQQRRLQYE